MCCGFLSWVVLFILCLSKPVLTPLKSSLKNHWAVSISGNWRLTFAFTGTDAELVDYQDYH
ncbi:MAG: type II toxin-antitoxin system RelE/ParE family toxin [Comamonas sp.]|nr:type II toxin-antitoxin system RelE/ParE family toxin [Comamonas sp.]